MTNNPLKRLSRGNTHAPVSIALKWSLLLALLFGLGMGGLGFLLIKAQERNFERNADQLGERLTQQLAQAVAEPLLAEDRITLGILLKRQLDLDLVVGVALYDHEGQLQEMAGVLPPVETRPPTPLLAVGDSGTLSYRSEVRFNDVSAGQVELYLDRSQLDQSRRELVRTLVAAAGVLMLLMILMAFPLARWMSRPIRELATRVNPALIDQVEGPVLTVERNDEIGVLARQVHQLASDAAGRQHAEETLERFLSPQVARSVLSDPNSGLPGGRAVRGSVLFCDIVGFTALSHATEPERLGELVNDYFGAFASAGALFGGTVDKFIGDCIMILFGVPEPDVAHARNAVSCGVALQQLATQISTKRAAARLPTVRFRLAVNSGAMLATRLGNQQRMEFTVVGDSVNIASRLCAQAPVGDLVLSTETLREPGVTDCVRVEVLAPVEVKGHPRPVDIYRVLDLVDEERARILRSVEQVLPAPDPGVLH